MKQLLFLTVLSCSLFTCTLYGQTQGEAASATSEVVKKEPIFPEIKGYVGLVHPLYTWSNDGNHANFDDYYLVGNPWGINIWKSKKVGISFEFTPFIRIDNKTSKLSNFLFHPGILYRLGHDFAFIFRGAYETSGRYGFTPILNKVYWRGKDTNLFAAVLLPTRFGNNQAPSLTVAFQFGIGF